MAKVFESIPAKEFSGEKVMLRPLEKTDLSRSLGWLKDPLVNKYLSQDFRDLTMRQEEQWFEYIRDSSQDIVFAILEKGSYIHIGNCALHKINRRKKTCELGIVIGEKDYWDRGFGTDAVNTLTDIALQELDMARVRLNVYVYNRRAIKVYGNCGFRMVKVLKRNHFYNGRYWDTFVMEYP